MNEPLLILGMMCVTFGVRYGVMRLVSRLTLPQSAFRALRYVPPAVLAAIIAPALLMPNGAISFQPTNTYLWAGIITILVSWRVNNLLAIIIVGMGAFLVWRVIFPV